MSDSQDLTFTSLGPSGVVHYARCWPCQFGQHYSTPTWHTWADDNDIERAIAAGLPDRSDRRCACPCVDDPAFCEANIDQPDDDEPEAVSLNAEPCPVCDATDACGYDADGRPLIHAIGVDDDD